MKERNRKGLRSGTIHILYIHKENLMTHTIMVNDKSKMALVMKIFNDTKSYVVTKRIMSERYGVKIWLKGLKSGG